MATKKYRGINGAVIEFDLDPVSNPTMKEAIRDGLLDQLRDGRLVELGSVETPENF